MSYSTRLVLRVADHEAAPIVVITNRLYDENGWYVMDRLDVYMNDVEEPISILELESSPQARFMLAGYMLEQLSFKNISMSITIQHMETFTYPYHIHVFPEGYEFSGPDFLDVVLQTWLRIHKERMA